MARFGLCPSQGRLLRALRRARRFVLLARHLGRDGSGIGIDSQGQRNLGFRLGRILTPSRDDGVARISRIAGLVAASLGVFQLGNIRFGSLGCNVGGLPSLG